MSISESMTQDVRWINNTISVCLFHFLPWFSVDYTNIFNLIYLLIHIRELTTRW